LISEDQNLSREKQPKQGSNDAAKNAPLKDYILTEPAVTMHKTSMSSIGQNGYSMSAGRKTLGVRRTMNGWDNRKYK
jgi:hypothetical protein